MNLDRGQMINTEYQMFDVDSGKILETRKLPTWLAHNDNPKTVCISYAEDVQILVDINDLIAELYEEGFVNANNRPKRKKGSRKVNSR